MDMLGVVKEQEESVLDSNDHYLRNMRISQDQSRRSLQTRHEAFMCLMQSVKTLGEEPFWEIVEKIREKVVAEQKSHGVGNLPAELYQLILTQVCWEFFFSNKASKQTVETWLGFIKTYDEKVHKLYKPLFNEIKGCGDDCYGDILDSFPLFGETMYNDALKGVHGGSWKNFYQGENYIKMKLFDITEDHLARWL